MVTFVVVVVIWLFLEAVMRGAQNNGTDRSARTSDRICNQQSAAIWHSIARVNRMEIAASAAAFVPVAPRIELKPLRVVERALDALESGNLTYPKTKPKSNLNFATVQPIFFKPGEPATFDEYQGQDAILSELQDAIAGMEPEQVSLPPQMFLGPAGTGKTLLAKVLANELQNRARNHGHGRVQFFELLGYDIDTADKLDEIMKHAEMHPGCVMFIDEIHGLSRPVATKLYALLEEHRYAYQGELLRTLAPFTLVGATTDYGMLEAPMQRRWQRHQLERSTPEQLRQTIERRSLSSIPIDAAAVDLLVSRVQAGGAQWEAVRVYGLAAAAAKAAKDGNITEELAQMVLDRYGIDERGLDRYDRQCLSAIFTQPIVRAGTTNISGYRCSEDAVAAIAGVDKAYYRDTIRPKLMSRGLLVIRGGQQLTPKAVELYGYLR